MVAPIVQANKLNLLGLINAATAELGLPQYTSIISNNDTQALQLLSIANREGKEFSQHDKRADGWEELRVQYKFSTNAISGLTGTVAAGSTTITGISSTAGITAGLFLVSGNGIPYDTRVISVGANSVVIDSIPTLSGSGVTLLFSQDAYPIPNDVNYFIPQTTWDRTYRWQLLGPLSAQEWQVLKSGISPTGPRRRYRVMGNLFYIDPPPSDSLGVESLEYYSNAWCQSVSGAAQSKWTADTNYYTLDDDCFILGVKWRFLAAKKLDYQQEFADYQAAMERVSARNGGTRYLPLNATARGTHLLSSANVPDTGFGS